VCFIWMGCTLHEMGDWNALPALMCGIIPLAVSGGFHVDGFMDTMDAFHSYQSREKKLEILKDSHIGAFAVIMLALYGMVYLAAYSEILDLRVYRMICAGFFLSRTLSGIAVLTFPKAKKDGLVHTFDEVSKTRTVRNVLWIECNSMRCVYAVPVSFCRRVACGNSTGNILVL